MSALGESTVKAADVYRARYPSRRACRSRPYSADRMRELCSAGSGVGLAVPDPPLLRITLPGMYWTGGSASGGSEDCGVGPWGISTPGGFNPPGGGYVGSLGHYLAADLPVSLRGTVGQWFLRLVRATPGRGKSEPQTLIIRESHPSSKIRSRYWRGGWVPRVPTPRQRAPGYEQHNPGSGYVLVLPGG